MLRKTGVVGVSVRDDIVRVLQFSYTGNTVTVHAIGKAKIPENVIVNGTVESQERLGAVIRQACDSATPHSIEEGERAICALPESKTFVRIMSLPRMPDDQIASAVQWEMEGYVPLPLADVYYDWQHVPVLEHADDQLMSVVVVASARSVVDGYIDALEHGGLRAIAIEADSVADARALMCGSDSDGGRMILYCGDTSSRLAIIVGGVPIFAVSVPVGYRTFIVDVMRALNVSAQEAERIIVADGIGSYIVKDPLFDAVLPSIHTISDEVRKSADFCLQTLSQCKQVTSVLFCGKGAMIKGLRSFIVKESGLPVRMADPWQCIERDQRTLPPLSRTEALDAVTVIGLASRKLSYADFD